MPRVRAEAAARAQAGLYQFLTDREESAYQDWVGSVHGGNGSYPRSRRLAALRAGRPVACAVYELPMWARPAGTPPPPRSRAEWSRECDVAVGRFVTVFADDRVVLKAVDGAPTPLDEFLDL
ncbi:hypothetical protein [Mycobacterium nebraskense]|uniref:hypothetical protein n=1 Tax=Mycobacterium nebraskense TaxID=244292 RepID=UPI000617FC3B|nr:hypothetical protein [Mycobacterium nebraskense]KKC04531.1 hypothetical protein WU83_13205 [Mycobacterium nebraskense]